MEKENAVASELSALTKPSSCESPYTISVIGKGSGAGMVLGNRNGFSPRRCNIFCHEIYLPYGSGVAEGVDVCVGVDVLAGVIVAVGVEVAGGVPVGKDVGVGVGAFTGEHTVSGINTVMVFGSV
jgi:hypothetical protein